MAIDSESSLDDDLAIYKNPNLFELAALGRSRGRNETGMKAMDPPSMESKIKEHVLPEIILLAILPRH